jgi:hypothetical protein
MEGLMVNWLRLIGTAPALLIQFPKTKAIFRIRQKLIGFHLWAKFSGGKCVLSIKPAFVDGKIAKKPAGHSLGRNSCKIPFSLNHFLQKN